MGDFIFRFLLSNIIIGMIIGIFLLVKWSCRKILSSRAQYNLWIPLLILLAVPFIPIQYAHSNPMFSSFYSWIIHILYNPDSSFYETAIHPELSTEAAYDISTWGQDFALSINTTYTQIGFILFGIWIAGIIVMLVFLLYSVLQLHSFQKTALPLQNPIAKAIYYQCLIEIKNAKSLHATPTIPIYSTAYLKSPILVGLFQPTIYIPISIISDYDASELRYILLHELQHYKHKDMAAWYLMNFASILYWFNPMIWYARTRMKHDREIACDTSVLHMLHDHEYEDYGRTLIHLAETISSLSVPFSAGISGTMKQLRSRILNIASYKKPAPHKNRKSILAFCLITIILSGLSSALSSYADEDNYYRWNPTSERIMFHEESGYFDGYQGSFVLYDSSSDTWHIYNPEGAVRRISPNSTYKIYDALFGLEENVITPDNSFIAWNQETYPFDEWNSDQTLDTAMKYSVNWYFQAMDEQLGATTIQEYVRKIGYGNQRISGSPSAYWLEGSLKISPIEQVELLQKLYDNRFDFQPENVNKVRESILLSSSESGRLYGKTGTGRIKDQDTCGWFIGYIETENTTYFFATNIEADDHAAGSNAAEITLSILSDLDIWK